MSLFFIQLDRFFWILTASQCIVCSCSSFLSLCLNSSHWSALHSLVQAVFLLQFPGYLGLQDAPTYKCLFCLFVFIFKVLETNKHRCTKEKYSQEIQKFQGRNTHKCYFLIDISRSQNEKLFCYCILYSGPVISKLSPANFFRQKTGLKRIKICK